MLNRPVPKSSKLGILGLFAIIIIGALLLPMGCGPTREIAMEKVPTDNIIVPHQRIGQYTFDMSKDDILKCLGEPELIFYENQEYTLDNLPEMYYMCYDDISFRIHNDSVKEIAAVSPLYRFANGLGVGDSEQMIKQAFGRNFYIEETGGKDFLIYEDKGLQFEIHKNDRTVMELSIYPYESSKYEPNAVSAAEFNRDFAKNIAQFDIDNADLDEIIETFGRPLKYIWGQQTLDGNNLPGRYIAVYPSGFHVFVFQNKIVELRFEHQQPKDYLFLGKLKAGSSLEETLEVLGQPTEIVQGKEIGWVKNVLYKDIEGRKGHCYYHRPDKNVRIFFGNYKISGLYVTRTDYHAGGRGGNTREKADIPPTSFINEKGHIVDKIDYPFVNDPQVIGTWKSVDYVGEIEHFKVGKRQWPVGDGTLFLHEMIFKNNGKLITTNTKNPRGYPGTWTKGLIIYNNDTKTASEYTIKNINGSTYMFRQWKSGDYTFRHSKPSYYVLKKISSQTNRKTKSRASILKDAELARQRAELAKQQAELEKARAQLQKDQAELQRAMAELERAKAETAKQEAEQAKAEAELIKAAELEAMAHAERAKQEAEEAKAEAEKVKNP